MIENNSKAKTCESGNESRSASKLCLVLLLTLSVLGVHSSENRTSAIPPIGYFIDTLEVSEDDPFKAHATVVRDGETYDAIQGMEVYPGDIVNTPASGGIAVALLNNNTVELGGTTTLTVVGVGLRPHETGNLIVNSGAVTVTSRASENNGLDIALGATHHEFAKVTTVKPAKLDIICLPNPSAPGGYSTTVYATAGTATLTPVNGQKVDIGSLGVKLLTVNTPVTGVTSSVVTIAPTATTKNDLKAGQTAYKSATSGSEIQVTVGKNGSVTFKATLKDPDGTKTSGSFTTVNGNITKDSWKTTGANKFSESWSEDKTKGKITIKQTFGGISFSASLIGNTTTKATIKGPGGLSYTGTATLDPATGIITFVTTKPAKDGSTIKFTFNPKDPRGPTQTATVTSSTGVVGATTVHSVPPGPPSATTPDGHAVDQNSPPSSQ